VLPLRELILDLKPILDNNKGAEELAKVPKNRPRTKHIAVKYHHFCTTVQQEFLLVKRVDTLEQLADIFTKTIGPTTLRIPATADYGLDCNTITWKTLQ
jgi:hypothetical protein